MVYRDNGSSLGALFGAMVFGTLLGASAVLFSSTTVREEMKKKVGETSDEVSKRLTGAQQNLSKTMKEYENKTRDMLVEELMRTQKQLARAQKQLESGKKA